MEKIAVKRLDHISLPLPDRELDDILSQLDRVSDQLENPDTAGQRAVYRMGKLGEYKRLRKMDKPNIPLAERIASMRLYVKLHCATREVERINQYSPRAISEYLFKAYSEGTLLRAVNESVIRRTGLIHQ